MGRNTFEGISIRTESNRPIAKTTSSRLRASFELVEWTGIFNANYVVVYSDYFEEDYMTEHPIG
jgi:hypothetical protein